MEMPAFTQTVLVINPGSTSTKIAVYRGKERLLSENISHSADQLEKYPIIVDQYGFRSEAVQNTLLENGFDISSLDAVVGRGGTLKPLLGGVYSVNDKMIDDLINRPNYQHASNLGAIIAKKMADELSIPSFIVDPVCVDELEPFARLSGMPELPRTSIIHALSVRSTARKTAESMGKELEEVNVIVAHMGGGISICPVKAGKMVDVNNANEEGPFSAERSGSLPVGDVVKMCYSGKYTLDEMSAKVLKKGGFVSYLNTNDGRDVEKMIESGNEKALEVTKAMAYQIAKEIGAMAVVLEGKVDAIAFTGGLANWKRLVDEISSRCSFIAPIHMFPGENEMEALAIGALRVLAGLEEAKEYV